jgi:hypothetical protein
LVWDSISALIRTASSGVAASGGANAEIAEDQAQGYFES